jgi:hypothetical protein
MNDVPIPERSTDKPTVLRIALNNAINSTIYFIIVTILIILIGMWSWTFGVVLACIGAFFAAIHSIRILLLVVANVAISIFGEQDSNEAELRWATLVRVVEFSVWIACLYGQYRFFFS